MQNLRVTKDFRLCVHWIGEYFTTAVDVEEIPVDHVTDLFFPVNEAAEQEEALGLTSWEA